MMTREKARELMKEFENLVLSEEFEKKNMETLNIIDEQIIKEACSGAKNVSVLCANEIRARAVALYYWSKRRFQTKWKGNYVIISWGEPCEK